MDKDPVGENNFMFAWRALTSLAKLKLKEANERRIDIRAFPCGMSWDALGPSSKSGFMREARIDANIDEDQWNQAVVRNMHLIEAEMGVRCEKSHT